MWDAPSTWRASTWAIVPRSFNAAYSGLIAAPGTPNAWATPSISITRTAAITAFIRAIAVSCLSSPAMVARRGPARKPMRTIRPIPRANGGASTLQVVDVHPVPGRADDHLVDAGMRRQFGDEADRRAEVVRLQHAGAVGGARRHRPAVEDRRGHFGRADRAGADAVHALLHVDRLGHRGDGVLAAVVGRTGQLRVKDAGPRGDVDDEPVVLRAHRRQHRMDRVERAVEVDPD